MFIVSNGPEPDEIHPIFDSWFPRMDFYKWSCYLTSLLVKYKRPNTLASDNFLKFPLWTAVSFLTETKVKAMQ